MMGVPNFNSDALTRLAHGNPNPAAFQQDAIGRLSYRANQNRNNFHRVVPPNIDTKGMPPALAGRLGGGMPNYRQAADTQQHMRGKPPIAFNPLGH